MQPQGAGTGEQTLGWVLVLLEGARFHVPGLALLWLECKTAGLLAFQALSGSTPGQTPAGVRFGSVILQSCCFSYRVHNTVNGGEGL